MTIKVINEIPIYAVEGRPTNGLDDKLKVLNHWNESNRIVLHYQKTNGETMEICVTANDLICAIQNATNTGRSW